MEKLLYILSHWKLGVHHLLKTRRFGVDNQWFSPFDSLWGQPFFPMLMQFILIYPLIRNYQAMKVRLGPSVGLIPKSDYEKLFSK